MEGYELIASVERIGNVSKLTCPDCHGALWEISDEDILRFRYHVGHAYSADSLSDGQSQMLEVALWSAVRALEEQMMPAKRIVDRARRANNFPTVHTFERRVQEAERHSSAIRQLLLSGQKGDKSEQTTQHRD